MEAEVFRATKQGKVNEVERLLEKVRDITQQKIKYILNTYRDNGGETVLTTAAKGGNKDLVSFLLDLGASLKNPSALIVACENGRVGVVRLLLDRGADIACVDRRGNTLLHTACRRRCFKMVKLLLDRGAGTFINEMNKRGQTALNISFKQREHRIVWYLFDKGAVVFDSCDKDGDTALHKACRRGEVEPVKKMLELGAATFINEQNIIGKTALIIAYEERRDDIARILLDGGAKIEISDSNGDTILHRACRRGDIKTVDVLLKQNAITEVINKLDSYGKTALQISFELKHYKILQSLLDKRAQMDFLHKKGNTILHSACQRGKVEIVEMLLDRGALAMINIQNGNGYTPLLIAYKENHSSIMRVLLNQGAEINISSKNGNTILHMACERHDFETVEMLLDRGAMEVLEKPNKLGKTPLLIAFKDFEDGQFVLLERFLKKDLQVFNIPYKNIDSIFHAQTALEIAVEKRDNEMIKILLNAGASTEDLGKNGNTILHSFLNNYTQVFMRPLLKAKNACDNDRRLVNCTILKMLLDRGAEKVINKPNIHGETALEKAVKEGHNSIVKVLLHSGASIEGSDKHGNTILHHACLRGDVRIVQALLDQGANTEAINLKGETPLDCAVTHQEVVQCRNPYVLIVKAFLKKCPNLVNSIDKNGLTLLHTVISVVEEPYYAVSYLLDKGADVDKVTPVDGFTPLHLAIENNKGFVAELLVCSGADVNIKDKKGNSPLHMLAGRVDEWWEGQANMLVVLKKMLQRGACVKVVNDLNQTPYDTNHAESSFNVLVKECLLELEKMKHFKIFTYGTLKDVLDKAQKPHNYFTHEEAKQILHMFVSSKNACIQFPLYYDIMKDVFERSERRLGLLAKSKLTVKSESCGAWFMIENTRVILTEY